MADLDDFFAKKDKKKKGKKAFSKANVEVVKANLEDVARKDQKAEEKENRNLATTEATKVDSPLAEIGNDDEWLDYSERKKDYSGLKIETLKIGEEQPEGEEEEDEHENEDGEKVRTKKGDGGPWNKQTAGSAADTTNSQAASVQESKEKEEKEEKQKTPEPPPSTPSAAAAAAAPKPTGGYVPPHLRNLPPGGAAPAGGGMPTRLGQRRSRVAPNINSEMLFPSLSGAAEDMMDKKDSEHNFEEVHAGRAGGGSSARRAGGGGGQPDSGPKLALANKFDALVDES